jgi:hypothetical protein
MDLKNQSKFYRELKISEPSIYYIELGEEICKVTVLVDQDSDDKKKD